MSFGKKFYENFVRKGKMLASKQIRIIYIQCSMSEVNLKNLCLIIIQTSCKRQTDRPTNMCKAIYLPSFEGGIIIFDSGLFLDYQWPHTVFGVHFRLKRTATRKDDPLRYQVDAYLKKLQWKFMQIVKCDSNTIDLNSSPYSHKILKPIFFFFVKS